MKLHRWNGERWYVENRSIPARLAQWVVWVGGWPTFRDVYLRGEWGWKRGLKPGTFAPISLAGHRVTYYGWGLQVSTRHGYWVWSWNRHDEPGIYWSPNGTPSEATVWLSGTPRHVKHAAEKAQREQDERMKTLRRVA